MITYQINTKIKESCYTQFTDSNLQPCEHIDTVLPILESNVGRDKPAGAPMLVDDIPLPAALPTPVPGVALAAGVLDLS